MRDKSGLIEMPDPTGYRKWELRLLQWLWRRRNERTARRFGWVAYCKSCNESLLHSQVRFRNTAWHWSFRCRCGATTHFAMHSMIALPSKVTAKRVLCPRKYPEVR